jgi:methionyl-tRNA synthetase
MAEKKKFYLTTPIFYPNAKLHMGHAYTTTLSDIVVRYHKLLQENTYFLTGSDENTQKVVAAAKAAGQEPKVFLDGIVENFKKLFASLDISYDQFIRTSDEKAHWPGAIALWNKLEAAGDLYKKEYEGLYCVGHEAFITEKELVDGKCPDHGTVPERIKEENYFFKLSRYTEEIRKKIIADELQIVPSTRKREILSLLDEGLQDVSFSRPRHATSVGVPVPGDDSQVMYVWCDALSNYITALGYGRDDALYQEFWQNNEAKMHVIGKDILRFHAAIWPGMLLSAGLPLPKTILVHGFITSGGKKMSKTLGNVIDPEELLAEYGTDAVRYFLARHISPFEDGDLTLEHFKDSYNADLANGIGNLASRIMQLAQTHLTSPVYSIGTNFKVIDSSLENAMRVYDVQLYVTLIQIHISNLNEKIQLKQPFKVIKENQALGVGLISDFVKELALIAKMLEPIIPQTSQKIIDAIMANKKPENLFPRKD